MKFGDKFWYAIIASICIIYVALRFWNLTASCLWFDEIFSVHAATHSWENLFWFVAQDLIHPPLFYVLLKIWISIGGESLFWLRFSPVFFSIVALLPFILLCRELKLNRSTIAIALTFFAVNGSLIKYTQEVRMYSVLLCFALFSMWLFARFFNSGKSFWALTIVNVLLVYTHYFGWFVILSEVTGILILQRIKIKQILLMLAINLIAFAPWIFAVWNAAKLNANVGQNIGWMTKPDLFAVLKLVFDLFEPIYFEQSNTDEPAIFLITIPIIVVGIVAFGFYFADWKNKTAAEKRDFLLLSIFALTPVFAAFAASRILPYSIWGTRHLIIAFAPVAILSAIVFTNVKFRQLKIATLIFIFLLFGAAIFFQAAREKPVYIWCAWENLANNLYDSKLHQEESANVRIYAFEDLVAYHLWFALRDSGSRFQVVKVNGIENLIEDKAYFLPRGFEEIQTASDFAGDRFFVAFRDTDWNEAKPPLQNLISQGYKIGEPQVFTAQGLKAFLVEVRK